MSDTTATMLDKKPFLIRALWEWLNESGVRPHVVVNCGYPGVQVPPQFRGKETVFNIAMHSTEHLVLGNDAITCHMRFNQKSFSMVFPMGAIKAVFSPDEPCRGDGMMFEMPTAVAGAPAEPVAVLDPTVTTAAAVAAKKPNPFTLVKK